MPACYRKEGDFVNRQWFKAHAWLLALVLLLVTPGAQALSATAKFRSGQDVSYDIPFDEKAFQQAGQVYQHELAQSSLGMALSAFREKDGTLQERGRNIRSYLTQLQFEHVSLHQFDIPPSVQTIASAVAMKRVQADGEDTVLLAVAVSGGGYADEWKSNFTIGTAMHHEGFDSAARQVFSHVRRYISEQGITGRVKVWISGYSRAAATANRTAAMLMEQGIIKQEDMYAYTFATPNVTRQENAENYPSIFNIVGAFDPVPMVPFGDWGYRRYGKTYYLPSPEINSDYARRAAPVNTVYRRMMGRDYWQNITSNRTLFNALTTLAGTVSTNEEYAENYQQLLIGLWDKKDSPWGMLQGTVSALWQNSGLRKQMNDMADNVFTIFANAVGENLYQSLGAFDNPWQADAGFAGNLMHEHYPQGYLAWLMAYDDLDRMRTDKLFFRQVLVNAEAKVRLLDHRGRELLSHVFVESGEQTPSSSLLSLSGDALVLTVPADAAYRVELSLAQGGDLQLAVREGKVGRTGMLAFTPQDLTATPGTVYSLSLPSSSLSQPGYMVTWPEGKQALSPGENQEMFTALEQNSEAKEFLRRNGVLAALLLVMVLIQAAVYGTLMVRGLTGRKRRKANTMPRGRRGLWIRGAQRARNALKATALVTTLAAVVVIAVAVIYGLAWTGLVQAGAQRIIVWMALLGSVPSALVVILACLSALAASGKALFWPDCDMRSLKGCRGHAWWALLLTAVMLYLHLRGLLDMPWRILLYGTIILMVGLTVQALLSIWLLRAAKRAQGVSR